jgi:hypothetical protein
VDDVEGAPDLVLFVVSVVQALADLHHDEAGLRDGNGGTHLARTLEDGPNVFPLDELQGDVEGLVLETEVVNLRDVRVLELDGDMRLVLEHRDELFILRDVRKDAFHRNLSFETIGAVLDGLEHLGHTADADPLEQVVRTKGRSFSHRAASVPTRVVFETRRSTASIDAVKTVGGGTGLACSKLRVLSAFTGLQRGRDELRARRHDLGGGVAKIGGPLCASVAFGGRW